MPCPAAGRRLARTHSSRKDDGKIAPLGTAGYCGGQLQLDRILVPSSFQCNQFNANLAVATIPVDASGAFKYTGDAPIGPGGAIAR
jgi:hypothetical protein